MGHKEKNSNLGQYEFGSRIVTYRSSSLKMNGIVVWKKEKKKERKKEKERESERELEKDRVLRREKERNK